MDMAGYRLRRRPAGPSSVVAPHAAGALVGPAGLDARRRRRVRSAARPRRPPSPAALPVRGGGVGRCWSHGGGGGAPRSDSGMGSGRLTGTFSMALVSAAIVLVSLEPANTVRSAWGFMASGAQCLLCILGFSAIPWTALFVAVHRAAPLDPPVMGAYVGAAAVLFAAAAVRIACPIDEEIHLLAWHMVPIATGAALSAAARAGWLARLDPAPSLRVVQCGGWRVHDAVGGASSHAGRQRLVQALPR